MPYSRKRIKHLRGLLADFAGSGQTITEFCKGRGLARSNFYRWRALFAPPVRPSAGPGLELLPVPSARLVEVPGLGAPRRDSGVELEVGGVGIRLSEGFDADTLRRVLEIAGGRPC